MPRKSNVEMEGVLERAVKLHEEENMTIKEIAELLKAEGFIVSASGVQRALRAKKLSEKEFQKKLKDTEIFIEATKNTPGLQIQGRNRYGNGYAFNRASGNGKPGNAYRRGNH
ncbi:hypothetical protein [Treponema denticola]|uniref:hypothetical protein n=1 Tax=Treponema denticola TaxID=158 RepID=UPI003F86CCAA